ncbi:hypothetical protein EI555_007489 [Monodon monoceros]|uniref:Promethin n=1 Tax=Monodon monoceros TaxID=40151 RepID=A0A4V5P882_MONMO|nr:hypothetical protein EI555_007489 [Monodon monoceros]
MVKEEPPSTSKDFQELQRRVSLLIASVQSNSKVVAFMKSPVGQYLDRHPFLTLTLLVFSAVSAVPVGCFLLLVVLTSLAAFLGVILLEGLVISVGSLSLLCVLCGLGFVSLIMSGTIIVSYMGPAMDSFGDLVALGQFHQLTGPHMENQQRISMAWRLLAPLTPSSPEMHT